MKTKLLFVTMSLILFVIIASAGAMASGLQLKVNGDAVDFDVQPTVIDGEIFVPLRPIYEALGARVEWYGAYKTINVVMEDERFLVQIGNTIAWIKKNHVTLETNPVVINNRTLVPLEVIALSIGAEVEWDQQAATVNVITQ